MSRRLRGSNCVIVQRDCAIASQGSSGKRGAGIERDGLQREYVSLEDGVRSQSGRGADLPEDILRLGISGQNYLSRAQRSESGTNLEDERGVGITLRVQGDISR